jgi:hypothetical protein
MIRMFALPESGLVYFRIANRPFAKPTQVST